MRRTATSRPTRSATSSVANLRRLILSTAHRGRCVAHLSLTSLTLLCVAAGVWLGGSTASAAMRHDVRATTFEFLPRDITVDVGDTVRWVWEFGTHTVTEGVDCNVDDPMFNFELLPATPVFEYVFNEPGRVDYFCIPHCVIMDMKGSVTARPSVPDRFYQAELEGEQMVPPVETEAYGHVQAYLSPGEDRLHVQVIVADLTNPMTASHVHFGVPGMNGPQIFDLGIFSDSLAKDMPLTPTYRNALKQGQLYVAVHTVPYPVGELRGQLLVSPGVTLQAPLKAEPPIVSNGVGFADITLWGDSTRVHVDLSAANLHGTIIASHIHEAPPGEDGPIVFDLGAFNDRIVKDLAVTPAQARTFLDGGYYVNVHTDQFIFGEIRGQIEIQTTTSVPSPNPKVRASLPIHVMPVPTRASIDAHFTLPVTGEIRAEVFGPDGRAVRQWTVEGQRGMNTLSWDGLRENGEPAPTGVYFLSIRAGQEQGRTRVLIVR